MPLNWNQLRTITTRELSSALRRDGFMLKRQTGSHQIYRHPDGRRVRCLITGRALPKPLTPYAASS